MSKEERECNIAPELFKVWKKLFRYGDVVAIATQKGYSVPVVRRALKYGWVSMLGLPAAINDYFNDRLELEKQAAQGLHDSAEALKKGGK